MRYLILLSLVLLSFNNTYSQTVVLLELYTTTDYITTPNPPSYEGYGYDNQFGIRYGAGVSFKIWDRFRLGIGAERYTRKQDYECVHFPDLDSFPQRTLVPLINNPAFSCDYSYAAKISFLEVPISLHYDFIKARNIDAFVKLGYGYQFVTNRTITLVDLQDDVASTVNENTFSLRSRNTFRVSTGVSKSLSTKLELALAMSYRSDSFQFDYQAIGLSLGLNYIFL